MSDKARLTNAELELTQRIQLHFSRGVIPAEVLKKFNGCSAEIITKLCAEVFSKFPDPIPEPLIEWLGIVSIPATTRKFVAREKFVRDTSKEAHIRISYLGDNFTKNFIEKVEESFAGSILRYGKLRKSTVDGPIIAELGGGVKAETTLTEMFALMEQQGNGEEGALSTNGYANLFYIRDIRAGMPWTVYCIWLVDGWHVTTSSVGNLDEWGGGGQTFSRNPSESQS